MAGVDPPISVKASNGLLVSIDPLPRPQAVLSSGVLYARIGLIVCYAVVNIGVAVIMLADEIEVVTEVEMDSC